jgi:hypothetical protein
MWKSQEPVPHRHHLNIRQSMAAEYGQFGNGASAGNAALLVRFQHSHPIWAGTFSNVGIKGPLAKAPGKYVANGAMELAFARWSQEFQIGGTGLALQKPLVKIALESADAEFLLQAR